MTIASGAVDPAQRRSLLFSARMRFSPQVQPVRQAAIDKMLEQGFLLSDQPGGVSPQELVAAGGLSLPDRTLAISPKDLRDGILRLEERGRLLRILGTTHDPRRYRLAPHALDELWQVQASSEARFQRVVDRVFRNAPGGTAQYAAPFLDFLSQVFAYLGEAYVRVLKRELQSDNLLRVPRLREGLLEVRKAYPSLDHTIFEQGVFVFFRDPDPDYDAIKWNLAQNYYLAKMLGLDPTGMLLSREVFGNAIFYLDTNVIIPAVEPSDAYHQAFRVLRRACGEIGADVKLCQISLDELRRVMGGQRDLINRVAGQIPDALAPKVRGTFYELYCREFAANGAVDLDRLFLNFDCPMDVLRPDGVELVDHQWFVSAPDDPKIQEFAEQIRSVSVTRRPWRPKRPRAAMHDAVLLYWIRQERAQSGRDVYVVTLDTSLPFVGDSSQNGDTRPLAVTLDVLLQWISPVAVTDGDGEDQLARVFSHAIKYLLLPQDSFLELQDFWALADLEASCKSLPPDDVEKCIRSVKARVPQMDPSNPADREKLAHEYAKFFAGPGTTLQAAVTRLQEENLQTLHVMEQHKEDHEAQVAGLRQIIAERDLALQASEDDRSHLQRTVAHGKHRSSGIRRVVVAILVGLPIVASCTYIAWKYGSGTNWLQRIGSLKEVVGLGFVIALGCSWFIIGKERLQALGWPWNKIFKE